MRPELFRALVLMGTLLSPLACAQLEVVAADAAVSEVHVPEVAVSEPAAEFEADEFEVADTGAWSAMIEDGGRIPIEFWGTFAGITTIGIRNWDWGTSGFHFQSEGWFGYNTGSAGTDKLGHAFMCYSFANNFSEALIAQGVPRARSALSGAMLSQALAMYVEVFDGYSEDHGFSGEDVVFNLTGTGIAWLRQAHPEVAELVDYRMEYLPSGYKGFNPISDYAGMKFLFAFKLAGIDSLRDTPLRYVELQGGYFSRGYTNDERREGIPRTRHDFIGVGINLNEVFLGKKKPAEPFVRRQVRYFLEHYQIPYTAGTHDRR